MLHNIYTIFDEKAEAYLQPFFMPNDAMALRAIADCVADPQHQFGRHPADFTLFQIAVFSDSDATFSVLEAKRSLGNCVEMLADHAPMPLFLDEETE